MSFNLTYIGFKKTFLLARYYVNNCNFAICACDFKNTNT